ncbi:cytochrome-c peroxidase [Aquimarina sp. 2201CG14-23]|uniref:cytochrome-c peroxidase n=1 Tax=Aquimarina mycalae TaxID=3040073 RepID=UPI002478081B|nr:cytochrome c peroxidase [Aquimarina sp. 2201CG14-23]MDH7444890.1 cytochrome c peroxidase [Aquimarina sp. 2201CG14-23]
MHIRILLLALAIIGASCSGNEDEYVQIENEDVIDQSVISDVFGQNIDVNDLYNYENQIIPNYITQDNTAGNAISDEKATLGRVLFYDKNLSSNNTVACASCHQQAFAFGDINDASIGVNGETGRHSMRLVNARFAREDNFFWDERANTLEEQTTQPIQDHAEMGFSGANGDPSLADLLVKLGDLDYYQELFTFAYGDNVITETRLQESLAQFIRSIQSFDSKYDIGIGMVQNENQDFPNFTAQENLGKSLFMTPPNQNGAGCVACHTAPEFDIDPQSRNNGIFGVLGDPEATDYTITRSPSIRDVFNSAGVLNGALMHDASMSTFIQVVNHYNNIDPTGNPNLDNRLRGGPGGNGQNLNLSNEEILALEAFVKTLSGTNVYTDLKWSDPFLN